MYAIQRYKHVKYIKGYYVENRSTQTRSGIHVYSGMMHFMQAPQYSYLMIKIMRAELNKRVHKKSKKKCPSVKVKVPYPVFIHIRIKAGKKKCFDDCLHYNGNDAG